MKKHNVEKKRIRAGVTYRIKLRPIFSCEHPVEAIGANAVEQCLQCHKCGHVFWIYPEDVEAWLAWDGESTPETQASRLGRAMASNTTVM